MFTFISVHLSTAIVESDACTVWQIGRPNILAARIPFDAAVDIIVFLLFCLVLLSISFNSSINKLSLITAESSTFCRCAAKIGRCPRLAAVISLSGFPVLLFCFRLA